MTDKVVYLGKLDEYGHVRPQHVHSFKRLTGTLRDATVTTVTGANRGIGFGLVKSLADRPDAVVFAGVRDVSKTDDLRKIGDNVHPVTINAGNAEDNKAAVETMRNVAGGVDVVIANAGAHRKLVRLQMWMCRRGSSASHRQVSRRTTRGFWRFLSAP